MHIWNLPIVGPKLRALSRKMEESEWGGEQLTMTFPLGEVVRAHISPPQVGIGERFHLLVVYGNYIRLETWEARLLRYFADATSVLGLSNEVITGVAINAAKEQAIERMRVAYPGGESDVDDLRQSLDSLINVIGAIGTNRASVKQLGVATFDFANDAKHFRAPYRVDMAIAPIMRGVRYACNAHCAACYVADSPLMTIGEGEHELTTDEWKHIIDDLWKNGVIHGVFTGGDPTTRPDLVELVAHARKMVTFVNTNALLLTKHVDAEGTTLMTALREADLDIIQITFPSSVSSIYEAMMGTYGAFDRVVAGIMAAVESGVGVSINIPICSLNGPTLGDTLSFLDLLGVRYVTLSGLIPAGGAVAMIANAKQLSHDDLLKCVTVAAEYGRKNQMRIDFTSPGQLEDKELEAIGVFPPKCGACLLNMAIGPKGDVLACQSHVAKDDSLGNLLSTPWKKIWNSARVKKICEAALKNACILKDRLPGGVK